jgi:hypothetical protein
MNYQIVPKKRALKKKSAQCLRNKLGELNFTRHCESFTGAGSRRVY